MTHEKNLEPHFPANSVAPPLIAEIQMMMDHRDPKPKRSQDFKNSVLL